MLRGQRDHELPVGKLGTDHGSLAAEQRAALRRPRDAAARPSPALRQPGPSREVQRGKRSPLPRVLLRAQGATSARLPGARDRQASSLGARRSSRKNEFRAALSHDLRNPLAPVQNSLCLIDRSRALRQRESRASARGHPPTDRAPCPPGRRSLRRDRITRGKIGLQRSLADAREIVSRACDDHRALDLEVDASHPVWIDADGTRIA